jgi:hypothetical protein
MLTTTSIYRKLFGFAFLLLFASAAMAEDCYRGTLDKQYCDRNRDLVADLPLDPKEWVNPDTIIFSYTPVEDPAIYAKVWDGFIKHMSEVTGKKVVFFPVQSYAARSPAHCRRQHRRQPGRGFLRRPGAVRDDGIEGWFLRLRNGDHRAQGQRYQIARRYQGPYPGIDVAHFQLG